MKKHLISKYLVGLVSILVVGFSISAAFGQDKDTATDKSLRDRGLVGSWSCVNTGTTDVLRTLQSFSVGGVAFGTGQGDTMPPVVSPQIGEWKYIGKHIYTVSFESIIYDPSSGVPPGTFVGTARISETIRVAPSGKTFIGRFRFQLLDPDGNVIYENEGDFQGSRIQAGAPLL